MTTAESHTSLVEEHLWVARLIARRLSRRVSFMAGHYDDLYQAACLGLTVALQKFNPDKGAFSSVAWTYAKKYAGKYVESHNPKAQRDDTPGVMEEVPSDFCEGMEVAAEASYTLDQLERVASESPEKALQVRFFLEHTQTDRDQRRSGVEETGSLTSISKRYGVSRHLVTKGVNEVASRFRKVA